MAYDRLTHSGRIVSAHCRYIFVQFLQVFVKTISINKQYHHS